LLINNGGVYGGGIHSYFHSNISFKEHSNTTFSDNKGTDGEDLHLLDNCNIKFNDNSVVNVAYLFTDYCLILILSYLELAKQLSSAMIVGFGKCAGFQGAKYPMNNNYSTPPLTLP